jgi:acid phosphatase type 7
MKAKLYYTIIGLLISQYVFAQATLVAAGSQWKYLANGTDQGTAWRNPVIDETAWTSGFAELGYGDTQATCVPSGGTFVAPCNPTGNKWVTTYFRKTISVATLYGAYALKVKRDDGIVVYFNGVEVYRSNITGTVNYLTLAAEATDDGVDWQLATLGGCVIPTTGNLTIAVEIHQTLVTSSDISFDLELMSTTVPTAVLTRGPYLQMGTPTSMQFRWRTDVLADSKVSYGTSAGSLTSSVTNATSVQDHIITLTGLSPNTQYFYSIGSCSTTLQGTATNFFYTAPTVGTEKKTRIWATGDCGTGQTVQANVKNQFLSYLGSNYLDLWLLLGDNAYGSGLDTEFRDYFFGVYQNDKIMKQTVLFPAPGNHDYANSTALQASHIMPYYDIFSLPTAAEAGGLPSGTEAYYSYNYANIHFVSLDSYGYESTPTNYRLYDVNSPQVTWLKADLAANTQKWTILYWHHPPYTMGSHNSDTEPELINMRQNLVPILEQYKVDLVLCGHSHTYERSRLMKGHYLLETSFVPGTHNPSSSSGRYDGSANSCPYIKYSNAASNIGILYVVAGSAGWQPSAQPTSGQVGTFPHDAMQYSNATIGNGGSLYLEIEANRLDAKWITEDGSIKDQFTIMKDVNFTQNVSISTASPINISASWIGTYVWQTPTSSTKSISINNPMNGLVYYVHDTQGCLNDVIQITGSVPCQNPINMTTQIGQNSVVKYESGGLFTANNAIELGANVKYDAAKSITLSPGFTAKQGSIFKAYIDGCGNLRMRGD